MSGLRRAWARYLLDNLASHKIAKLPLLTVVVFLTARRFPGDEPKGVDLALLLLALPLLVRLLVIRLMLGIIGLFVMPLPVTTTVELGTTSVVPIPEPTTATASTVAAMAVGEVRIVARRKCRRRGGYGWRRGRGRVVVLLRCRLRLVRRSRSPWVGVRSRAVGWGGGQWWVLLPDMPRESLARPASRSGRLGSRLGAGRLGSHCPGADELGVSATGGRTRAAELPHTAVDRKVETEGHSSGG